MIGNTTFDWLFMPVHQPDVSTAKSVFWSKLPPAVLYCAVRFACVVAVDAAEDAVAADPAAALALDDASPALIFAVFALFEPNMAANENC